MLDVALLAADVADIRQNGLGWGNGIGVALGVISTAVPFLSGLGATDDAVRGVARVAARGDNAGQWGRNRLVKELHERGFVLDRPTTSGDGLLYRNAETGAEIRIMPKPATRFRNDPPAKHESAYYFRHRSGPDQPWGPHTSIPDK